MAMTVDSSQQTEISRGTASLAWLTRSLLDWQKLLADPCRALPWPSADQRSAWQDLLQDPWPQAHRQATLSRVKTAAQDPWPLLPASLLRRFALDGNRELFQQAYFARRERITDLALLWAMDEDHCLVDDLVDGLWLICEESSWCLPAHWHLAALPRRPVQELPPCTPQVDLFAAETAALLALACDLCSQALNDWSRQLVSSIRDQVLQRCIEPVLASEDWFWWDGHHNWSPWIVANMLTAGAVFLQGDARDALLVQRLAGVLQRYLEHIPEDGYCDEGPSYWNAGTGMTVVALDLLYQRSRGLVNGFTFEKLRAMGAYFNDTYLGHGRWVINADSKPLVQVHPEIPILLGQRCGLPDLEERGWELHQAQGHQPPSPLMGGGGLGPRLRRLWWLNHRQSSASPASLAHSQRSQLDTWFASGQLAILRENSRPGTGCSAAIKFGNNRENHNHLDVGQVIVQWDDLPLIIDPGVDTYRSDHFSPLRYSIPWIGGEAHNAPLLNHMSQSPGTGFGFVAPEKHGERDLAARTVSYTSSLHKSCATGDLAPCYPDVHGLQRCQRSLCLERHTDPVLTITDHIHGDQTLLVEIAWLSACQPQAVCQQGWQWSSKGGAIYAKVSGASSVCCQEIELEDPQLCAGWGRRLWRILVTASPSPASPIVLRISRQNTTSILKADLAR